MCIFSRRTVPIMRAPQLTRISHLARCLDCNCCSSDLELVINLSFK